MPLYADRRGAGNALALVVRRELPGQDIVVIGLPRGGVPVAYEVAEILRAPLDVVVVRKLGVPGQEELALGALASGGIRFLNRELIRFLGISEEEIEKITKRESSELDRRERLYRDGNPAVPVEGKTVVLVDDGLATGASMSAAASALGSRGAPRIVVAVPVGAQATCQEFEKKVDQVICLATPEPFASVGNWYEGFSATSDEEVRQLLTAARLGYSNGTKMTNGASNSWGADK